MPTAYLSPSQLQDLTNVSSTAPGSGDNGKALVWNQAAGRWQAEQVAYSSLSGAPALPIPVGSGGTGTQTGSITGTGALTFASASNGNISLNPNGTGIVEINKGLNLALESKGDILSGLRITLPANEFNRRNGIIFEKGDTNFTIENASPLTNTFWPAFVSRTGPTAAPERSGLYFASSIPDTIDPLYGTVLFAAESSSFGPIPDARIAFGFWNWYTGAGTANPSSLLFRIMGSGNASLKGTLAIQSTASSTSTTTGALQVAGGIGAQGNLIVGGTRINYANLPTSSTGLAVGDLWRDGDVVKVKL